VDVDEEEDVDKVVDQSQRAAVINALHRNLIAGTSCRLSSSRRWLGDCALSLEPPHNSQRDNMIENNDTDIRGDKTGLFSCVLSSIHDVSFYT
jgi:hypothetical protein